MFQLQNAGKNNKIANIFFQNVAELNYLMTVTNQNWIHEEIKGR
jgi:hypothetical protein